MKVIKIENGTYSHCEKILNEAHKKGNQSEEMFFALLKTYTAECLYRPVNNTVTKGLYENL